jgi:dimethylamine/trimethylamine dehydrogenase
MEIADIRRVQADWVRAARRARDVGFDIVYVYGAHSYLPVQFLSPFYNRRTDSYGGSFENRARFWLELLELVRDAVGSDCAIACRIAVEALGPAGVGLEESLAFIRAADELVDLWDVNVGSISEWSKDSGASRFFAAGYQLEWTGRVREATAKPIVGVGRLTDPDQMASIIRSGAWDVIGAARPSIADPFLPRKIEEGRYGEVRECIGCNVCILKSETSGHIGCTQNATAGEEYRRGWHPERFSPAAGADRDVLVVGAGPAGMECAIVLGKRGFRRVHLVDAASEPGGAMRWIPNLPGLGEWRRVVNWRVVQIAQLRSLELICGSELDAGSVREYGAELVILATGARWASDGVSAATHAEIEGAQPGLPHLLTPEQIMVQGRRPPGERVVVYDADGYFMGAGIAELLAGEGHRVQLVTNFDQIAPTCDNTLEGPLLRQRLFDSGVMMRRGVTLNAVESGVARGRDEFDQPVELAADGFVLVTQRRSDDALYRELVADPAALAAEGIGAVYRIGDCVAPRLIADAIFDGHRMGREIDTQDPSLPLPYLRERATVDTAIRAAEGR